jgi:hypothetical protein
MVSFTLGFSLCHDPLPRQKVWQIKDERSRSEVKVRWRGGEIRTTQPNQRSLEVRCNGKDARTGEEYTLARSKKSNKIWTKKKSIKIVHASQLLGNINPPRLKPLQAAEVLPYGDV